MKRKRTIRENKEVYCLFCGEKFILRTLVSRFCSKKCSRDFQNKNTYLDRREYYSKIYFDYTKKSDLLMEKRRLRTRISTRKRRGIKPENYKPQNYSENRFPKKSRFKVKKEDFLKGLPDTERVLISRQVEMQQTYIFEGEKI